ncbi:hypothetical protein IH970_06545 [candidate division KSB1 bacterium]|nr:hypothetical protein [candidate division KSB1 bacterium]
MENSSGTRVNKRGPNFWLAVILIAVGVLFLLDNLNVLDIGNFWEFWPVILIAVGLMKLTGSNFQDKSSASVLIGIGLLFLLLNLDILYWDEIWQFWPLILILIGVSIIFKHKNRSESDGSKHSENRIDIVAIFGGNSKTITSDYFEGGNITALFGGVKLDFGQAKLAEGENVLDVFAMFGGAEIRIPKDWNVQIKGVPIFGGFEDGRHSIPAEEKTKGRTLVIKGFVMFGGLELKDA